MEEKNYYDWLEISRKASPEVIEKAYKALVKKYHPDLQEENKLESEEILKKINEAYDVLSDNEKRAQYDATLNDDGISKEDYDKLQQELNNLKQKQNYMRNRARQSNLQQPHYFNQHSPEQAEYEKQQELERQRQEQMQKELEYQRQVEAARIKAYHDAYIQDLRNRGYKIRYKKSFKDYVRILITIIVLIGLAWIAWQIPFIRNWIVDSCNDNPFLKSTIGIFLPID